MARSPRRPVSKGLAEDDGGVCRPENLDSLFSVLLRLEGWWDTCYYYILKHSLPSQGLLFFFFGLILKEIKTSLGAPKSIVGTMHSLVLRAQESRFP